ncbi:MAG: GDP-mannose 4,6-dehydratase, partial [Firmicutes bacterium]|nr:GDP-mannose 4,6-dehydratase [Bacillota bacterium]
MTILVTGGAGFIGSHFIALLKAKASSVKIICVDSLTYAGRLDTLSSHITDDDFVFSKADICDREKIYELFERHSPDIVINFAAETHVDTSINSPSLFYKTNIYGTSVLLDACVKYGTHRFHQVSTDEVYGDTELNAPTFFDENAPLRPSSPYSASKASADMLTLAYHRTFGLYTTISRSSNNYGPSQNAEKLIPKSITKALSGEKVSIYGDGMNIRDWIYVDDNCEAIWSIVLN